MHTTSKDRRSAPRYPITLPIEWEMGAGIIHNMSATGAFFKTKRLLSVGALITFFLGREQPQEDIPFYLHGQGKIARIEPYDWQWGIGLCFIAFRFRGIEMKPTFRTPQ
jgi:hypothetical protein